MSTPASPTGAAQTPKPKRKPKPKQPNPISSAILVWLDTLPRPVVDATGLSSDGLRRALVDAAPRRWVVYHPMVLLPAGSFAGEVWDGVLAGMDAERRAELWEGILRGVGAGLTHLAVGEGIPAQTARAGSTTEDGGGRGGVEAGGGELGEESEEENVIRAPTKLRMLHGDFGPEPTASSRRDPTSDDFDSAFWVVTKQNGIVQTWAPRYTMFSRGNVKEKARLLGFHASPGGKLRRGASAVDLYAGIGYFAFSYARLGLRVLCWEINAWSVEALRRGAGMNGWSVRVVRQGEHVHGSGDENHTIIVFEEDNAKAADRVRGRDPNSPADVVHVNCGLLPYSTPTWRDALYMVSAPEGWLHLHENVGVADIERRRHEIQASFDGWLAEDGEGRKAVVEHVEQVKTYAPGVWHCVFDVHVAWPGSISTGPEATEGKDGS